MGGVDKVIPVDVYVPGCAARPESIIDGVVKALAILDHKRDRMKQGLPPEEKEWSPKNGEGAEAMQKQEERIQAQIQASDAARAAMRKEQEEELHGGHE